MFGYLKMQKIKFILASNSPRRKELIGHLKIPFEIVSLNVEEKSEATKPQDFCLDIAKAKGISVYEHLKEAKKYESLFVVSADTIVCLDGKIYEKPKDRNHARQFLKELSGKTHSVFTAVHVCTFISGVESRFSFVDESRVTFEKINDFLMEQYLDTNDSLDKAGAYGIQGPSLTFISKVDGSYSNVVGFPLSRFYQEVSAFFGKIYSNGEVWPSLF